MIPKTRLSFVTKNNTNKKNKHVILNQCILPCRERSCPVEQS